MSIVYPLDIPEGPGFGSITIRKSSVVGVTRSPYSGAQQAIAYPGQWWEADVGLPTLNPVRSAAWEAFLGKLNGREGTFLLGDPVRQTPRGSALPEDADPIAVHGAHAARSQTLTVRNAMPDTAGWLLAGDHVQVGTGLTTRLHQLLDDADADEDGHAVLTVWPRTRAALADGAAVAVTGCRGLFRMSSNIQAIDRRRGPFASFSFTCIEAI